MRRYLEQILPQGGADSCRVLERESISCKKQIYDQEWDHVGFESTCTRIWNAEFLSQCVKNIVKGCNLTSVFCMKQAAITSSLTSDYHIYTLYITSLLFFSLVIVFPNSHQSEHESDLCPVPETGIIISSQLMSRALWFSWLTSLGCFKDIYVIVPETANLVFLQWVGLLYLAEILLELSGGKKP